MTVGLTRLALVAYTFMEASSFLNNLGATEAMDTVKGNSITKKLQSVDIDNKQNTFFKLSDHLNGNCECQVSSI